MHKQPKLIRYFVLCLSMFLSGLQAEEFLVYQGFRFFELSDNGFHYYHRNPDPVAEGWPADWTQPHDFWNGHFEIRVEVFSTPQNEPFTFQPCIWMLDAERQNTGESQLESCCYCRIEIEDPGVYTIATIPIRDWWHKNNGQNRIDLSRPHDFQNLGLVLRDDENRFISPYDIAPANWDDRFLYLPIDFHLTVVAVAAGSDFSGWENYPRSERYDLDGTWSGFAQSIEIEPTTQSPRLAATLASFTADTSGAVGLKIAGDSLERGVSSLSATASSQGGLRNRLSTLWPDNGESVTEGVFSRNRTVLLEDAKASSEMQGAPWHRGLFLRETRSAVDTGALLGTWQGLRLEFAYERPSAQPQGFEADRYTLDLRDASNAAIQYLETTRQSLPEDIPEQNWFIFRRSMRVTDRFQANVAHGLGMALATQLEMAEAEGDPVRLVIDFLLKSPAQMDFRDVVGFWRLTEWRMPEEGGSWDGMSYNLILREDRTFSMFPLETEPTVAGWGGEWTLDAGSIVLSGAGETLRLVTDPAGEAAFGLTQEPVSRLLLGARLSQQIYPAFSYFGDTRYNGEGWVRSTFFGWFHEPAWPFIYHQEHGWIYCAGEATSSEIGFWFYDATLGWTFTNRAWYPLLYAPAVGGWFYHQRGSSSTSGSRWMYDYQTSAWRMVDA